LLYVWSASSDHMISCWVALGAQWLETRFHVTE
jgi:hypothetical protein